MNIEVPAHALRVLNTLEQAGYSAYLVGGCVRDSVLDQRPNDWDVATNALPAQVMACFAEYSVVETGVQHGTVTVLVDKQPCEVTTFRVDGAYGDRRRPDEVFFVRDLRSDLARRDFTMNALAYHPERGMVDYFHGLEDIAARRIACVGEPEDRLAEDALRIMRVVRFAATLDFAVEERTANAAIALAPLLRHVAVERIRVELDKALVGPAVEETFLRFAPILAVILPELCGAIGAAATWSGALRAISRAPRDNRLRLAILLAMGATEAEPSAAILRRLRYDNDTRKRVECLVLHSGEAIRNDAASIKRWLGRLGEDAFRDLLALQHATCGLDEDYSAGLAAIDRVIGSEECYRIADLAVNGDDLLAAGIAVGRRIGALLRRLLEAVIEGIVPNEREALLAYARKIDEGVASDN